MKTKSAMVMLVLAFAAIPAMAQPCDENRAGRGFLERVMEHTVIVEKGFLDDLTRGSSEGPRSGRGRPTSVAAVRG